MPSQAASRASKRGFLLVSFLVLLCISAAGSESDPGNTVETPSVLLVTIDSLRTDHIGCYGYTKPTSPWLDQIAAEGVLFQNAFTQGGWTSPAMVSIFTGTYPSVHGVEARGDHFPCKKSAPLLAWRNAGYRIPGWGNMEEDSNYSRLGFQEDLTYGFKPEQFFSWVKENRGQPFFCWYHINKTPHLPYNPSGAYRKMFSSQNDPEAPNADEEGLKIVRSKVIIPKGTLTLTEKEKPGLMALYDGEVRMADDTVGSLYRFLLEEGLLDSTILIITADHGEELLDHGVIGHASTNWAGTLFDETIHVPLIIRYPPSIPGRRVVKEVVESLDILPTLQEMVGISAENPLQGRSLLPLINGQPGNWPGIAFSENSVCGYQCRRIPEKTRHRLASVRTRDWKLIATHEPDGSSYALYRMGPTVDEEVNRIASYPDTANHLKDHLLNWYYQNRILRQEILQSCTSDQE